MKALNWGYVIGTLVGVPLLIILVNFLFFKGNKITPEIVNNYIADCEKIKLIIPPRENSTPAGRNYKSESKVYYPKLTRGNNTRVFDKFIFFSEQYQKYFAVISIEFSKQDANLDIIRSGILAKEATFTALVNTSQLNNDNYGSIENTVPVLKVVGVDKSLRYQDQDTKYMNWVYRTIAKVGIFEEQV